MEFLRLGLMLSAVADLVLGNAFAWDDDNDWIRLLAAAVFLRSPAGAGQLQSRRSEPSLFPPGR